LIQSNTVIIAASPFVQGGPDSWLGPGRATAREVQPGLARGPNGPRPALVRSSNQIVGNNYNELVYQLYYLQKQRKWGRGWPI